LRHDLRVPELAKVEKISSNILTRSQDNHHMTKTYTIEILHQGETHTIEAPEDKTILRSAGAAGLYLPTSCSSGVCTTCAAQVMEGEVEQGDGMGVSNELQAKGYVLLCVAYPRSNLKIVTEKEDEVYEIQFGQHQR
jgi:ferredoxin